MECESNSLWLAKATVIDRDAGYSLQGKEMWLQHGENIERVSSSSLYMQENKRHNLRTSKFFFRIAMRLFHASFYVSAEFLQGTVLGVPRILIWLSLSLAPNQAI